MSVVLFPQDPLLPIRSVSLAGAQVLGWNVQTPGELVSLLAATFERHHGGMTQFILSLIAELVGGDIACPAEEQLLWSKCAGYANLYMCFQSTNSSTPDVESKTTPPGCCCDRESSGKCPTLEAGLQCPCERKKGGLNARAAVLLIFNYIGEELPAARLRGSCLLCRRCPDTGQVVSLDETDVRVMVAYLLRAKPLLTHKWANDGIGWLESLVRARSAQCAVPSRRWITEALMSMPPANLPAEQADLWMRAQRRMFAVRLLGSTQAAEGRGWTAVLIRVEDGEHNWKQWQTVAYKTREELAEAASKLRCGSCPAQTLPIQRGDHTLALKYSLPTELYVSKEANPTASILAGTKLTGNVLVYGNDIVSHYSLSPADLFRLFQKCST